MARQRLNPLQVALYPCQKRIWCLGDCYFDNRHSFALGLVESQICGFGGRSSRLKVRIVGQHVDGGFDLFGIKLSPIPGGVEPGMYAPFLAEVRAGRRWLE
jgi:hypothetical protein